MQPISYDNFLGCLGDAWFYAFRFHSCHHIPKGRLQIENLSTARDLESKGIMIYGINRRWGSSSTFRRNTSRQTRVWRFTANVMSNFTCRRLKLRFAWWQSEGVKCRFATLSKACLRHTSCFFARPGKKMAERGGFEPPVEFPLHSISNAAP